MEYVPLFLLMAAALIAGWFYLQRAKARDSGQTTSTEPSESAAPQRDTTPSDRPQP